MRFSLQQLTSKASLLAVLLLQSVHPADGHYGFPIIIVNGVASKMWEYVRSPADPNNFNMPLYDYVGESQVCGIGATTTGHQTSTAVIAAGSTISFRVKTNIQREFDPSVDTIYHQGPGQAYMSKAPGALEDYTGDGEWFKIGQSVASDGQHWDSNGASELNFTIPSTTPPGKYLLRVEHLNISYYFNGTQFFINCAQVEVTGPGGGTPGPTIKFPGGYDPADPAIWLPRALYNPSKPTELLKKYNGPGPQVWTG